MKRAVENRRLPMTIDCALMVGAWSFFSVRETAIGRHCSEIRSEVINVCVKCTREAETEQ